MTDVISENESLRNQVESVGEMTCSIVVKYNGLSESLRIWIQASDPEDKNL
jgi:hypothetical protein